MMETISGIGIARAPGVEELRAGALSMLLEEGEIRAISFGARVLIDRVYFTGRSPQWDTFPAACTRQHLEKETTGFHFAGEWESSLGGAHLRWTAAIDGYSESRIVWRFEAVAGSEFLSNRIGLCVLHHPETHSGCSCRVTHGEGNSSDSAFPRSIAPYPLFTEIAGLDTRLPGGGLLSFRFDGDVFETEDQRNWGDASFKTYSRPLNRLRPFRVRCGEVFRQSLRMSFDPGCDAVETEPPRAACQDDAVRISVDLQSAIPLPRLGLQLGRTPLSRAEADRIAALRLNHLRVDASPDTPEFASVFGTQCGQAAALDIPLEIALSSTSADPQIDLLLTTHRRTGARAAQWLLFHDEGFSDRLFRCFDGAAIASGTNKEFVELNRHREYIKPGMPVTFSVNPQVHACDTRSLIENLPAAGWLVQAAQSLAPTCPVFVSTVTLKPRFNSETSSWQSFTGDWQAEPDLRQSSGLAAAWTLASLRHLALSGAASLTYYEAAGPRGVLETAAGAEEPTLFPVWHVFSAIAGYQPCDVLPARSSHPLEVEVLALRGGRSLCLLVGSFASIPRAVSIAAADLFAGPVSICGLPSREPLPAATTGPDLKFEVPPGALLRIHGPSREVPQ